MKTAYLSLGSNVLPETHLPACIEALAAQFGKVSCSTTYRCPAVGFDGGDFWNLAAAIDSPLSPEALDAGLKALEERLGRRRNAPKFSDRVIDIDLLFYGEHVGHFGRLELPRPDVLEYAFVLAPLAELAPRLVHPQRGLTLAALWVEMSAGGHELSVVRPPLRGVEG